jgi:hypothetical protein
VIAASFSVISLNDPETGKHEQMRIWVIVLKIFGYLWIEVASILIVIGIVGVWMKDGFGGVQYLLSPFNIVNWLLTAIVLAPGIGSLAWAAKIQENKEDSRF